MRKSKYDLRVLYKAETDEIICSAWDYAIDRVPRYYIRTSGKDYYIVGADNYKTFLKSCVELDRIPEGIWREWQ